MMTDSIYTEIIMYHNKEGHNKHLLDHPSHVERGHNPNCGDDLTLQVEVEAGFIKDASFVGNGCAISTAAMSIMIDLVKGKSVEDANQLVKDYLEMIRGHELSAEALESLEDAQIFASLQKMPARVKCGTLGWHCMRVVLESQDSSESKITLDHNI
ncbi:Fe-S cluster assembly sulfur transfer protein SufU [Fusibacter sp. 3D3]|uniref:Fe-S cluster assembly sulfur transfer protein SufU n=1 Tax=Fusibacter sp. 3D3 TaxID=1048380 RepID=UPI00085329D6|nr:SUF system NifU family Fe-S cluster assembly protein [Fusibacter sp. 3D3]GAU76802.1 putative iron-sulfur cluster assembly scaffold protein for SUF system SufE2 [Fusibacter sp. 3D3]